MGDIRLVFGSLQVFLQKQIGKEGFTQSEMAASIFQKIEEYWKIMNCSSIASAILDPRTKLSVFSEEDKPSACEHIQAIFETYQEHSSSTQSPARRLSSSTTTTTRRIFTQLLRNP